MTTTYANQRAITINRTMPQKGTKKPFLAAYYDSITTASKLLTGEVAFKLYLYLLSNQDKHVDFFSPQKFANDFGVSADRCRKVFQQLEEAGYLEEVGKNEYQFYEMPRQQPTIKVEEGEKRIVPRSDGSTKLMTYEQVYKELHNYYSPTMIDKLWAELEKGE